MREIPLTNSPLVALCDDEDYPFLMEYCWHWKPHFKYPEHGRVAHSVYLGMINGRHVVKRIEMHRVVMGAPTGVEVDHRDHNTLNNQKFNLRQSTKSQNRANRIISVFHKASPFKGVGWLKKNHKWHAQIGVGGSRIHLGCFNSQVEAARAYNDAAQQYFGEFALLNPV